MKKMRSFGFTLLEVMVALVMIAIAFSAIYLALSTSTRTQAALQDKTAATWVGLNVIAKRQANVITSNQSSGKETMLLQNWVWELKTQNTPNPSIAMLEVTVRKETGATITHLTGYITNKSGSS